MPYEQLIKRVPFDGGGELVAELIPGSDRYFFLELRAGGTSFRTVNISPRDLAQIVIELATIPVVREQLQAAAAALEATAR